MAISDNGALVVLFGLLLPLGFAVLAVNLRRSRGTLWRATAIALASVIGLALVLASAWGGNRLVATEGYGRVAGGVLSEFGFVLALPILIAAIIADVLRSHRRVLVLTMLATAGAIILGLGVALRILWAG